MSQPVFVDNRNGNTLESALLARLAHLADQLREPVRLAIASGYFNPEGFARLADALESTGGVRLLLGAEPVPPPARPQRRLGEPRGERFDQWMTQRALTAHEGGLLRDRDRLSFTPETDRSIRRLLAFLASGRMEVRRYEKRFLHGKAFLFSGRNGVLSGSSNFTAAGLQWNLELNLGHYHPDVTDRVENWFEELWADAVPYDLAAIYSARLAAYDPYLIYLRVLWERYGRELEKEATPSGRIELTSFQNDGLLRARRILDRYNGVLIADSVGLGKTFIAGALLEDTILRQRQRVLLIAPAALRDGTWRRFLSNHQLYAEVRSFEQVAQDEQLGGAERILDQKIDSYALIVVDEAHAYRNLDTVRSRALARLLRGDPPKKLVMMTATPVNNSLWDLHDLLSYFVGDASFAEQGIVSLERRFEAAARENPLTLRPDVLFDILDATTVRRTRHFVKQYYPMAQVPGPDGTRVTIQFPKPVVRPVSYDLDAVVPGLLGDFGNALSPEAGDPELTLARYWPSSYRRGASADPHELALVGLIRSGLLKRFESSGYAFCNTLRRMIAMHEHFLRAVESGVLPAPEALDEIEDADNDAAWERLLREGKPLRADEYDVDRLKTDVVKDIALLRRFLSGAQAITVANDPKLELLLSELRQIIRETADPSISEDVRRDRRKVLIFSYFADTAEWIGDFLRERLRSDRELAPYRGRMAVVRGTESHDGVSRRDAVFGFAPRSTEAPGGDDADRFDILITTDVLAEGMNLQQAGRIINYDLPWNPMRLVQRHGRIDRIGSPHAEVFITCIFPDRQLESMLALEWRIRNKLAQAAASIGLDQEVLPGAATSVHVFADDMAEIDALRRGNSELFENAGEDVHAHSGEEYRQELRRGLDRYGDRIQTLPCGTGSGLRRGKQRGHFFCARVDDRVLLRFVAAADGTITRDSLGCLSRITCEEGTTREVSADLEESAYGAWERARRDIYDEWIRASDPSTMQPDVRPLFRAAAAHLRQHRPPDISLPELDRACDALEHPHPFRIERAMREVFDPDKARGEATSRAILARVKELGLQPLVPPEPLPVIDEDEIVLVVWMAVEAETPSDVQGVAGR